jgi:hypothetical protein
MLSTNVEYTPVATNSQGGDEFPFPLGLARGEAEDYSVACVSRAAFEPTCWRAFFFGQKQKRPGCNTRPKPSQIPESAPYAFAKR